MNTIIKIIITVTLGANIVFADSVALESKVHKVDFSGTHYLGFVSKANSDGSVANGFETRRNYLQFKAYVFERDYFRITFDTYEVDDTSTNLDGTWAVRLKYAYVYLHEVLPFTNAELGQVHRPWIDFEEHGAWNYRSINKVFIEDTQAAHLTNSADLGFNLKTYTDYFSSEIGLFNGEGYHNANDGAGLSGEFRATIHTLGTSNEKRKDTSTYLDLSTFGVYSLKDSKRGNKDWIMAGGHGVYNSPLFLVAGQYVKSYNEGGSYQGSGYSLNTEIRPFGMEYFFIGRYDYWDQTGTVSAGSHDDVNTLIYGVVNKFKKGINFIANVKQSSFVNNASKSFTAYMLSAELKY